MKRQDEVKRDLEEEECKDVYYDVYYTENHYEGYDTYVPVHDEDIVDVGYVNYPAREEVHKYADPVKLIASSFGGIELSQEYLELGQKIGVGNFGEVFQGSYKTKAIAAKRLKQQEAEAKASFIAEAFRLSLLRHPNIVRYYGVCEHSSFNHIVMEFCAEGALWQWQDKEKRIGRLSACAQTWPQKWRLALGIAHGLKFLHSQGMLHRDLKTENILLDATGRAKLSDMGLARVDALLEEREATEITLYTIGDVAWAAPEGCRGEDLTAASDMYSYGMILWQLASGEEPYKGYGGFGAIQQAIIAGRKMPIPNGCPAGIAELILACWDDVAKRPTASQMIERLESLALDNPKEFTPTNRVAHILQPRLDTLIHSSRDALDLYLKPHASHDLHDNWDSYWQKFEAQREASDSPKLFQTHARKFLATDKKVLLLLGDGGVGKTLTTFDMAEQLLGHYIAYMQQGMGAQDLWLPILLRSGISPWTHSNLNDGINKALAYQYNLPPALIAELQQLPVLFILDGYDELVQDIALGNLPTQLGLSAWPLAKLLITSRANAVQNFQEEARVFDIHGRHDTCYLLPFSMPQIDQYLTKLLGQEQARSYQQHITPELRAILRNPYILSLFIKAFPLISKIPAEELTRYKIYQSYVRHWLTQSNLLSFPVLTELTGLFPNPTENLRKFIIRALPALEKSFNEFASYVSHLMLKQSALSISRIKLKPGITSTHWLNILRDFHNMNQPIMYKDHVPLDTDEITYIADALFANERDKVVQGSSKRALFEVNDYRGHQQAKARRFLESCPLQYRGEEYNFTHKSFFEYFACQETLASIEVAHRTKNSSFLIETLTCPPLQLEPAILELAHEFFSNASPLERVTVETQLLAVVASSRGNPSIGQAAANAMTLLNWMNSSLVNRDFSSINIPRADLSYAVLAQSNFARANLRGVNLSNSFLPQVDFTGANMHGVIFGRLPAIAITNTVNCVAHHPTADIVAVTDGSAIMLYDSKTITLIGRPISGHTKQVLSIAFFLDGNTLASGSEDGSVILWNIATRQGIKLIQHTTAVTCVAFSPNGALLAETNGKGVALLDISDIQVCKKVAEFSHPSATCVAFSPDGILATSSLDKTVIFWNIAAKVQIGNKIFCNEPANSIAFNPDGNLLLIGCGDRELSTGSIVLLDVASQRSRVIPMASSYVASVAFSPDGKTFLTGGGIARTSGTTILWDSATQRIIGQPIAEHTDAVLSVAFAPPDGSVILSGGQDRQVILRDTFHRSLKPRPMTGHVKEVRSMAIHPDGVTIATGGRDRQIAIWDLTIQRAKSFSPIAHNSWIDAIAFSHDGSILASGSIDECIMLWKIADQSLIKAGPAMTTHAGAISSITFSPNDRIIAAGCGDKVFLWDVNSKSLQATLVGHTKTITTVAFSPNEQLLASGGKDNQIILWDVSNTQKITQFPLIGHRDEVNRVIFSPDGKLLASCGKDQAVVLWDIASRNMQGSPMLGHTAPVLALAFRIDSNILASAGEDGRVIVWDTPTGQQLAEISWLAEIRDVLFIGQDRLIVQDSHRAVVWSIADLAQPQLEQVMILNQHHYVLDARGANLAEVLGLTILQQALLKQLGAIQTPLAVALQPLVPAFLASRQPLEVAERKDEPVVKSREEKGMHFSV